MKKLKLSKIVKIVCGAFFIMSLGLISVQVKDLIDNNDVAFKVEAATITDTWTVNNVTCTLDDQGTFTISGSGDMKNYSNNYSAVPWYSKRTDIKNVIIEDDVTSVGGNCFYGTTNLVKVTSNANQLTFYSNAFDGSGVQEVELNSEVTFNLKTFYNAKSLSKIYVQHLNAIPSENTSSSNGVFASLPLTEFTVDSVGDNFKIGKYAFSQAGSADGFTLNITGSNASVLPYAFSSSKITEINLNTGNTLLEANSFYGCKKLSKLFFKELQSLPSSNQSAGGVFSQLPIEKITIDSVVDGFTIGNYAFNATGTTEGFVLKISGNNLRTVPYAFNSSKVKEIDFDTTNTMLDWGTFYQCTNLSKIHIKEICSLPSSNSSANGVFAHLPIEEITFDMIRHGETDPSCPTEGGSEAPFIIGNYAFCNTGTSKGFKLKISGDNVKTVPYSFYQCKMTELDLDTTNTTLDWGTFLDCKSLSKIHIKGLNSLPYSEDPGNGVFANLPIEEIAIDSVCDDFVIGRYAFSGTGATDGFVLNLSGNNVRVGVYSFSNCKVKEINFDTTNTVLDLGCFYQCSKLTKVYIKELKSLPNCDGSTTFGAFSGVPLKEITIDSVCDDFLIGSYSFSNTGTTEGFTINFKGNNIRVMSYAFSNSKLTEINFDAKVTFDEAVFYNCSSLSKVHVKEVVASLPSASSGTRGTFYQNPLESVVFDKVCDDFVIGKNSFYGAGVTSGFNLAIKEANNVSVGAYAFESAYIKDILINADTITTTTNSLADIRATKNVARFKTAAATNSSAALGDFETAGFSVVAQDFTNRELAYLGLQTVTAGNVIYAKSFDGGLVLIDVLDNEDVIIDEACNEISEYAFSSYSGSYKEKGNGLYIPSDNNDYYALVKATGDVEVDENCKVIANRAFSDLSAVTVTLPNSFPRVSSVSFEGSNVTLILPDNWKTITPSRDNENGLVIEGDTSDLVVGFSENSEIETITDGDLELRNKSETIDNITMDLVGVATQSDEIHVGEMLTVNVYENGDPYEGKLIYKWSVTSADGLTDKAYRFYTTSDTLVDRFGILSTDPTGETKNITPYISTGVGDGIVAGDIVSVTVYALTEDGIIELGNVQSSILAEDFEEIFPLIEIELEIGQSISLSEILGDMGITHLGYCVQASGLKVNNPTTGLLGGSNSTNNAVRVLGNTITAKQGGTTYLSYNVSHDDCHEHGESDSTTNRRLKVTVKGVDINLDSITVDIVNDSFVYDGEEKTPTIVVKNNDVELVEGVDYVLDDDVSQTNVGNYTITINGIGGYSESRTVSWNITKADLNPTISLEDWTYGSTPSVITVDGVEEGTDVSYQYKVSGSEDLTYTSTLPTNAGDYVVKATFADTLNYNGTSVTTEFSITKAPLHIIVKDGVTDFENVASYTPKLEYDKFVNGDTVDCLDGALVVDTSRVNTSKEGVYPISASGYTSSNYEITYVEGKVIVADYGERELEITAYEKDEITSVIAGDTFNVVYKVTKNTGIDALQLALDYDHDAFTLTDIEVGSSTGLGAPVYSGDKIVFENAAGQGSVSYSGYGTEQDILFTVTFEVTDKAEGATKYAFGLKDVNDVTKGESNAYVIVDPLLENQVGSHARVPITMVEFEIVVRGDANAEFVNDYQRKYNAEEASNLEISLVAEDGINIVWKYASEGLADYVPAPTVKFHWFDENGDELEEMPKDVSASYIIIEVVESDYWNGRYEKADLTDTTSELKLVATYTINKAEITIDFADKQEQYKSFDQDTFDGYELYYTIDGLYYEDTVTVVINPTNILSSDVGTYSYAITDEGEVILVSLDDSTNYEIGEVSGTFEIIKKQIVLDDEEFAKFLDQQFLYDNTEKNIYADDDEPSLEIATEYKEILYVASYSGGASGCAKNGAIEVGDYTITATYGIASTYTKNYEFKDSVNTLSAKLSIVLLPISQEDLDALIENYVHYYVFDKGQEEGSETITLPDGESWKYTKVYDTYKEYAGVSIDAKIYVKDGHVVAPETEGSEEVDNWLSFVVGYKADGEESFVDVDTSEETDPFDTDTFAVKDAKTSYSVVIKLKPAISYAWEDDNVNPDKEITMEITKVEMEIVVDGLTSDYDNALYNHDIEYVIDSNDDWAGDETYATYDITEEDVLEYVSSTYIKGQDAGTKYYVYWLKGAKSALEEKLVNYNLTLKTNNVEIYLNDSGKPVDPAGNEFDLTSADATEPFVATKPTGDEGTPYTTLDSSDAYKEVEKDVIDAAKFKYLVSEEDENYDEEYDGKSHELVVTSEEESYLTLVEWSVAGETVTVTTQDNKYYVKNVDDSDSYVATVSIKEENKKNYYLIDSTDTEETDPFWTISGEEKATYSMTGERTVTITPVELTIKVEYENGTATFSLETFVEEETEDDLDDLEYLINSVALDSNKYEAEDTEAKTVTVTFTNNNYTVDEAGVELKAIYAVTFDKVGSYEGQETVEGDCPTEYIFDGEYAIKPETDPTVVDSVLLFWTDNYESESVVEFDFETVKITSNITIYAYWDKGQALHIIYVVIGADESNYGNKSFDGTKEYEVQVVYRTDDFELLEFYNDVLWFKGSKWYYGYDTVEKELIDGVATNDYDTLVGYSSEEGSGEEAYYEVTLYAKYKFDIGLGDVNGSGTVDANDITLIRQKLVGGYEMIEIEAGDEWSFATGDEEAVNKYGAYDAGNVYFLDSKADTNAATIDSTELGDNSVDIRDVSTIRMSLVGGYGFNIENNIEVSGDSIAIARMVEVSTLNELREAIKAGFKVKLLSDITTDEDSIALSNIKKDVYINLNSHTLSLVSFNISLADKNDDLDIYGRFIVRNGTISTEQGIRLVAEKGLVELEDVTLMDATEDIYVSAANHSLHLIGTVKFMKDASTETTLKVPATIHVVVEESSVVTVKKIYVSAVDGAAFTIDYVSETHDDIDIVRENDVYDYEDLVAATNRGGEVVLQNDVELESMLIVTKDVILNLDGHSITPAGSYVGDSLIAVKYGAKLTVTGNGTIDTLENESIYAAIKHTVKDETTSSNPSEIVIENGTIKGYYYSITGNGNRHNTILTINDGTFATYSEDDGTTIFEPQNGIVIINGGTFTATTPVEVRSGKLEINDGIFTSVGTSYQAAASGNGTTVCGAALAISQHKTLYPIDVVVNGGTFEGPYALVVLDTVNPTAFNSMINVTINGGTFNVKTGIEGTAVRCENGTLTIKDGTFTAGADQNSLGNTTVYSLKYGKIIIEGGDFSSDAKYADRYWVLNLKNADKDTASIEVSGGTFHGFDPAGPETDDLPNYVKEGYESVESEGVWTISEKAK